MDVDPVQQGAGDLRNVPLDLLGTAVAVAFGVKIVSAGAGVRYSLHTLILMENCTVCSGKSDVLDNSLSCLIYMLYSQYIRRKRFLQLSACNYLIFKELVTDFLNIKKC